MAEEDIYFAKLDQELIEALRQKKKKRLSTNTEAPQPTSMTDCDGFALISDKRSNEILGDS